MLAPPRWQDRDRLTRVGRAADERLPRVRPGGPDEDRRGGFDLGGWQFPYADEDMDQFITEWFEAADGFLLGRRTYDIWASSWPNIPDEVPVAQRLNKLPKYVASSSLDRADWNNTTIIRGDVAKAVLEAQSFENRMLKAYIRDWPAEG